MQKAFKTIAFLFLGILICFSSVSCKVKTQEPTNSDIISAITATEESVSMKIGESILLTNCYEIESSTKLSAAQKACDYTSSDESVVKINSKKAEAVNSGTVTITVTSKIDTTKSCTFTIVVAKVFIDRELSMIPSEDDFSKEWDESTNTGEFTTSAALTNYYYISDIHSTKWYVETDIKVNQISGEDRWPKIGFVARAFNSQNVETMVAFYLNASIGLNDTYDEAGNLVKGQDNYSWTEFGVCEVSQGGHWAWEEGITDSLARHHDYAWTVGQNEVITLGKTVKLGVLRNDGDFHIFLNGVYKGSFKLSNELDILMEGGQLLPSHVGFFEFSSNVTYSNYFATQDAAKVAEKLATIKAEDINFIQEFMVDEK